MTKEEKRKYMREYKKKNPEKIKAMRKRYYEKHKEQQKEYQKKWNEKNKERLKEIRHNYYLNHKEEMLKQNREWCRKNSAKKVEYVKLSRRRRVERLKAEGCINPWNVVSRGVKPKYNTGD